MDPDNPPHRRSGFPVHENQVPAALNQSDQTEAQGPQPPFSQVAHSTTGQAAPFHHAQYAPSQEELQVSYHQPNTARAEPVHYVYAAPRQEQPQVPHPPVAQVAQPTFAPVALVYDQADPGEPAPAQPQVPQPGAFAQAAVVQPGQGQRSRVSSRAPKIQREKENRQANAAELVSQGPSLPELESHVHLLTENIMQQANDPQSRNKLPWEDYEDEYMCRLYLVEASVDEMSKVRTRPSVLLWTYLLCSSLMLIIPTVYCNSSCIAPTPRLPSARKTSRKTESGTNLKPRTSRLTNALSCRSLRT